MMNVAVSQPILRVGAIQARQTYRARNYLVGPPTEHEMLASFIVPTPGVLLNPTTVRYVVSIVLLDYGTVAPTIAIGDWENSYYISDVAGVNVPDPVGDLHASFCNQSLP